MSLGDVLSLVGAAFMLVAALGVLRMPDVLQRLHCSTKAATLGVGLCLAGAAADSGDLGVWLRCVVATVFFLLTAPVAGHVVGRAVWQRDGEADD
ncbi:MAG: monovalent cation/H(+) antiporter subunit G [Myxococcales bacterium]|nr:monovalent cation/H(+) antiporter subunit G [Myxococcales bacterium]MCB9535367.1 monovalent cation/H(+) antiporter subunit G [Myxococcales bacterium]